MIKYSKYVSKLCVSSAELKLKHKEDGCCSVSIYIWSGRKQPASGNRSAQPWNALALANYCSYRCEQDDCKCANNVSAPLLSRILMYPIHFHYFVCFVYSTLVSEANIELSYFVYSLKILSHDRFNNIAEYFCCNYLLLHRYILYNYDNMIVFEKNTKDITFTET